MKIRHLFKNNILPDKYSKYSDTIENGFAVISFPFDIVDLPENTVSLAWAFTDIDAIPVCGFEYIHWVVANSSPNNLLIEEDYARKNNSHLKGKNSLASKFVVGDFGDLVKSYIGPRAPDKNHLYTLTVYALDTKLDLQEGFYFNELIHAMDGHVLDKVSHDFIGRC